jgi:hypothetical protein
MLQVCNTSLTRLSSSTDILLPTAGTSLDALWKPNSNTPTVSFAPLPNDGHTQTSKSPTPSAPTTQEPEEIIDYEDGYSEYYGDEADDETAHENGINPESDVKDHSTPTPQANAPLHLHPKRSFDLVETDEQHEPLDQETGRRFG